MASSIFGNMNNIVNRINDIKNIVNNGNPQTIANTLARTNPKFNQFRNELQQKGVQQVLAENGYNSNDIQEIIKQLGL